jgi:hypothetical protein
VEGGARIGQKNIGEGGEWVEGVQEGSREVGRVWDGEWERWEQGVKSGWHSMVSLHPGQPGELKTHLLQQEVGAAQPLLPSELLHGTQKLLEWAPVAGATVDSVARHGWPLRGQKVARRGTGDNRAGWQSCGAAGEAGLQESGQQKVLCSSECKHSHCKFETESKFQP